MTYDLKDKVNTKEKPKYTQIMFNPPHSSPLLQRLTVAVKSQTRLEIFSSPHQDNLSFLSQLVSSLLSVLGAM